ncbi:hypothetical protein, partial [Acetobacter malorum]|uniref:hypothetical protein n=1 Tax=Acetobacter malorum TaxID=178901 RepID=UPI0039ED99D1
FYSFYISRFLEFYIRLKITKRSTHLLGITPFSIQKLLPKTHASVYPYFQYAEKVPLLNALQRRFWSS